MQAMHFKVRTYLSTIVFLLLTPPTAMPSNDRTQARSLVMSDRGIVATSQTLASQAGAQILARGGSAADAAIAANAVLAVVEPMMNGIGGDLFTIYRDARTGEISALNASGPAPQGLSVAFLKEAGHSAMPQTGIHTVTVPGCVAGWAELHNKHGRLPWASLFAPAIYYAENGFPVTEIIAAEWAATVSLLSQDEYAKRVFLPDGHAPTAGDSFRNPDLAKALRLIASGGPAAFYRGPIAEALLKKSNSLGGTLAAADLATFQPEWVQPISTTYRGWRVYEIPPNSQGVAALQMLNLMERFDLAKLAPLGSEAFNIKMQAQKLAYADLARHVADPRFVKVPTEKLISKEYAASLPMKHDTIYLAAVDAQGNICSLIQSVFQFFGSGIPVDGFGFHMQNRGALFTLDEAHPNVLAPGKRPFHTIIPALMEKGTVHIGFGIMGGLNQAQAHAQFVSYIADNGMNPQAALEAPRFSKYTWTGEEYKIESRVPPATLGALRRLGFQMEVVGPFSTEFMGGGQAVVWDSSRNLKMGASDPRKDGAAIPEPAP